MTADVPERQFVFARLCGAGVCRVLSPVIQVLLLKSAIYFVTFLDISPFPVYFLCRSPAGTERVHLRSPVRPAAQWTDKESGCSAFSSINYNVKMFYSI